MRGKTIINFNFSVFLLTIILNGVRATELQRELETISQNGETIDGIFKPLKLIGSGFSGVTYKGQFLPRNNKKIAMKFYCNIEKGKQEYKMYTYLNAIGNPNILAYGIPSICYFGKWKTYIMLGMTLFNIKAVDEESLGKVDELQLLIAYREFMRIIKYINSRGIIHGDCHFENIIIQNDQGFMIDFANSMDMNEYSRQVNVEKVKYDFQFLLEMTFSKLLYHLPKSTWHWVGLSPNDNDLHPSNWSDLIKKLAKDAKHANKYSGLRRVLVEFAKNADDKKSTEVKNSKGKMVPFYDHLYQVICEECENYGSKATTSVSISSIPDPFKVAEYDRPEVDYRLFKVMYADIIKRARQLY